MFRKKVIITGIVTVGVIAGILACVKMAGNEKKIGAVAEAQMTEEPEIEAEPEELETVSEEIETEPEKEETAEEDEETVKKIMESIGDGLASLPTEIIIENEPEEEVLQASAIEEETENNADQQTQTDTSTQQPSGGSSSVPGISQADMDWLKSVAPDQNAGYVQTGQDTGEKPNGEYHLNQ